jgi:hypothetical protein
MSRWRRFENPSLDQTSPATSYPTSDRTELPIRIQGNDTHLGDPRDNHPPLARPNSPRQECPTDPPIACGMTDCAGSPYPPDPYRCKSRSTKIVDSIETTLFGCQCCSRIFKCDEEICNGGKELRCQSELLKGCYCIDPQTEPLVAVMPEVNVYPGPVALGLIFDLTQGRSTTPTEPPPTTQELEEWGRVYKDMLVYDILQEYSEKEILLSTALEDWLRAWTLGLKLGLGLDSLSS